MRHHRQRVLKDFFNSRLILARDNLGVTQEEMAHRLNMAPRTFSDLERGKNSCGALTLVLFMIYICKDPMEFLEELRNALETDTSKAA